VRRRGFTLMEVLVACSISVILMTAVLGLLFGVWTLAKEASDEMQGALHARALREKLFYHLKAEEVSAAGVTNVYGLVHATNILVETDEIIADLKSQWANGSAVQVELHDPEKGEKGKNKGDTDVETEMVSAAIDWGGFSRDAGAAWSEAFTCIYFKVPGVRPVGGGSMTYCDRLVVPKTRPLSADVTQDYIKGCFGD